MDNQQTKLEDLNFFWTKSGLPCFMADRDNIEDIVENLGFNIYYLICNLAEDRKVETKSYSNTSTSAGPPSVTTSYVTDLSTKIVKVINNFVGRAISVIDDEDIYDFAAVRETAEYNLPAIPYTMIEKLDEFFRLVDAQHGTESIVLLTFDPSKTDSSGWGVLVPEQVNTSVHCKYDAESVVDLKPEHVMIVGSVHSHPNMAAYASGTDHADQADFDGIHITFGWQKSVNGGATQYHIELQMGGSTWTLKPEDVFESFTIQKEPDPEVVGWTSKVKKAGPPTGGSVSPVAQTAHLQVSPSQTTPLTQVFTQAGTHSEIIGDPAIQWHPEVKSPGEYVVIAEVDFDDKSLECPSCGEYLTISSISDSCCSTCDIPICDMAASYADIIEKTEKYLERRNRSKDIAYYLWIQDDGKKDVLMLLAGGDDLSTVTLSDYDDDHYTDADKLDPYYYQQYDPDRLVCCNLPIEQAHSCTCPYTVYYSIIHEFDDAHPYDIYDNGSACVLCTHYYSRSCNPYHEAILDFARFQDPIDYKIKECDDFQHYSEDRESVYERD